MKDWKDQVFLQNLYRDDTRTLRRQNYVFGNPQIYFGFRMVNKTINTDELTKDLFPFRIKGNEYTIFESVGDDAYTYPIKLSTGEIINYISEGNFSTFYGSGGYMLTFPRETEGAFKLDYLNEPGVTTSNWINYYFAFLSINRNNNVIMLSVVIFDNLPSGEIIPSYRHYTISRFYTTNLDSFRFVLEILFIILSWGHLYHTFKGFALFVGSEFNIILKRQSNSMKLNNICFRIIEINARQYKQDSGLLIIIILKFIWFLLKSIFRLIIWVIKYSLAKIQNILDMLMSIIVLIIISKWIIMNTEDMFEIYEDGTAPGSIEYSFFLQKNKEEYRELWVIFIYLSFVNCIMYLEVSSRISAFLETLKSASFDLLFFIMTFILIILGFALIGNSLFGLQDNAFSYVSDSFLTIIEILCWAITIESITSYSLILKYAYGLVLTIVNLFLLDIMIAIIVSHYIEYLVKQGRIKSQVLTQLIDNFITISPEKQQVTGKGVLFKAKNCFISIIRNGVKAIRKLYFPKEELEYVRTSYLLIVIFC